METLNDKELEAIIHSMWSSRPDGTKDCSSASYNAFKAGFLAALKIINIKPN